LTISWTTFTAWIIKYPFAYITSGIKCFLRAEKIDTNKIMLVYNSWAATTSNILWWSICNISWTTLTQSHNTPLVSSFYAGALDIIAVGTTMKMVYTTHFWNGTYFKNLTVGATTIAMATVGAITNPQSSYQSPIKLYNDNWIIKYIMIHSTSFDIWMWKFRTGINAPDKIIAWSYALSNLSIVEKNWVIIFNSVDNVYLEGWVVFQKAGLYNNDKSKIVWFSVWNFTDWEIAKIAIDWVIDWFSWLTRRGLYKLSANIAGAIQSGGISNYLVWRAISDTTLKILIYNVNDDITQY
jgi:hypothetical protein